MDVAKATEFPLKRIHLQLKQFFREDSLEPSADIIDRGMVMEEGIMKLRNLDKLF